MTIVLRLTLASLLSVHGLFNHLHLGFAVLTDSAFVVRLLGGTHR